MNDRLLQGLKFHEAAHPKQRLKPEQYCSFCGSAAPGRLLLGPKAQICEDCTQIGVGMFLVSARDGIPFEANYKAIFNKAANEYGLHYYGRGKS